MTYPHIFSTPGVVGFADKVDQERGRQLRKWGEQHHPDGTSSEYRDLADAAKRLCDSLESQGKLTWRAILAEEIAEAFCEEEPAPLKEELIQSAAVIQAWIQDIDTREDTR